MKKTKKLKDLGHPVNEISNIINKTLFCFQRNVFSKFIKGVPLITHYKRKQKQETKKKKKSFNRDFYKTCKGLLYIVKEELI